MRPVRLASLAVLTALVAACSGGGTVLAPTSAADSSGASPSAAASNSSGASPSAAAPESPDASLSAAATRLEVALTDSLRIEPDPLVVPAGVPITFVVTNTGVTDHEFFLGSEAEQGEHEEEMMEGAMSHDEETGIAVPPGETKELTVTFAAPGSTLAGCHVAGHYLGGMKAAVTIEG